MAGFMQGGESLTQWLSWVPRVHPETGVQQVKGRWMAATPDNALHTFTDAGGSAGEGGAAGEGGQAVSEVGERIIALIDGQRTVGQIITVLCAEFAVERAECELQTIQFIELLISRKILSPR